MAIISISDSQVNGADQALVADSNSKIPAVDGSQITILNATNVATGTIASARLDTGTTANKLVLLDGSGNLPAVDASLLTGIVSATISASDPTISTNPSGGVGTEWNNSTSGEMYICTDATAGANVWTNVGGGSGDIVPYFHSGEVAGFQIGGSVPQRTDVINKFSFTSDADATDHGDCTQAANAFAASSSKTHGFHAGGWNAAGSAALDVIGKFAFSSNTTAADHGDLIGVRIYGAGCSSETHGYHASGHIVNGTAQNHIQKYAFTSNTTAADVGDLHVTSSEGSGISSATQGFVTGGANNGSVGTYGAWIRKWTFASDGNSVGHGDLASTTAQSAGCSGETHGIQIGGYSAGTPVMVDKVQKFAYASNTTASDIGTLIAVRFGQTGAGSTTHAYSAGGNNSSESRQNNIQKVAFSSGTNTTDVGDLTITVAYTAKGDAQY